MLSPTEILTTTRMRAIEAAAMASAGVSGLQLMEHAGCAVAGAIRLRWPRPGRVVVLCGPGNNGGDGYVVARRLHQAGWRVRVLGLDSQPGPDAAVMKRRWQDLGPIELLTEDNLRRGPENDLYVDAIFGTGLTRPPVGQIAAALAFIGGAGGGRGCFSDRLVAVDCPSGLCMDSGVMLGAPRAGGEFDPHTRLTVAFDSPRPGHLLGRGPILCGELVIADIGLRHWREHDRELLPNGAFLDVLRPIRLGVLWPEFPIADSRVDPAMAPARYLTKRSATQPHKFSHGHALIVAGGPGQGGAARLTARAALRVGAGLVTLCPPADALPEHAGPPDALMRRSLDSAAQLRSMLEDRRINALALGPGCGIARAVQLLPDLLASGRPCVLDADALTALSQNPDLIPTLHGGCVLTPHDGEFARLFPDIAARLLGPAMRGPAFSRLDAAQAAAARIGVTVLLKGPDTVIAAADGQALIHSAPDIAWLATAGAGDVLAGLITGLLARGLTPMAAAGLGALLHGHAARHVGPGLIADDLPDVLPVILRRLGA